MKNVEYGRDAAGWLCSSPSDRGRECFLILAFYITGANDSFGSFKRVSLCF